MSVCSAPAGLCLRASLGPSRRPWRGLGCPRRGAASEVAVIRMNTLFMVPPRGAQPECHMVISSRPALSPAILSSDFLSFKASSRQETGGSPASKAGQWGSSGLGPRTDWGGPRGGERPVERAGPRVGVEESGQQLSSGGWNLGPHVLPTDQGTGVAPLMLPPGQVGAAVAAPRCP